MKYKNYYKILGLASSRASEEEIKLAYRKLAKQYHPDINQGNEVAAEHFKDINEAYQVLSNDDLKRKYDRVHFAYRLKDGFQFKKSINSNGLNDFINMFIGKRQEQSVVSNLKNNLKVDGENLESQIEISLKEAFYGTEKKLTFKQDDGKMKTISVKIPKGIQNNSKVRLINQGKQGKNGGKTGDLLIKVKIGEDEKYKLVGNDFIVDLPITPWEAALGCKIEVKGIDSNTLVTVPAGIQSGERLRISGNGYFNEQGSRGDLLLETRIVVPRKLTTEENQLYSKLKQISRFSPRNN